MFQNSQSYSEDAFEMALALYDALLGIRMIAKQMEPTPWNKTDFTQVSEEEADTIFTRLDGIASRMDEVNRRRAMRD